MTRLQKRRLTFEQLHHRELLAIDIVAITPDTGSFSTDFTTNATTFSINGTADPLSKIMLSWLKFWTSMATC